MNDLLTRLIAAGTPAELVAEVAMELGRAQGEREALERRRANDRQRQQERRERVKEEVCHVTSRAVTDVTDVRKNTPSLSPSPFLPPDPQPTPAPTPTPAITARARKGTRLAEEWVPDPPDKKTAEMLGRWPPGASERELMKFRNYWLAKSGKDACKTDWQRTWNNWLLSADERMAKHERTHSSSLWEDEIVDPMVRVVAAKQARQAAERQFEHGEHAGDWP